MENYSNENYGGLESKNSSKEAQQRWRSLRSVVNQPRHWFRFTAGLSKRSEHAALRRSNQENPRVAARRESEVVPLETETTGENSSLRKIYKYAGLGELNEFMKQDFFQDVIVKHGKWERPLDLLSKRVLYDLLVLPAILYANGHRASSIQCEVPGNNCLSAPKEQPSDLLHGLQNLVLGPKMSRNDSNAAGEDDEDEEEGGHDDLEAGATSNTGHEVGNAGNDSEELCVSGLRRKGIYFLKSNGDGIRGIQFKSRMLFPGLYLPTVPLNQETELLFKNLKNYEMCQNQNEVRSFLGLMNKIISTKEDIKHLASKGILVVSKPQYGEKFIRMLQNPSETTVTNRDHQHVLQQLRDYSSNFRCTKFKKIAIIVLILTAAQTIFGILSYAVSLRQSPA